jgi:protocatechuate 3,4-dioxygenase beta subunit
MAIGKRRKDLTRREVLGAMGGVGAALLVGCNSNGVASGDGGVAAPDGAASAADGAAGADAGAAGSVDAGTLDCVVTPSETEGPFFVDEKLERADITAGTTEPFVVNGMPLTLAFAVYKVSGQTCTPLSGAQVDVWHASAEGAYSDEASGMIQSKSTLGETYLRGYQLTDANGRVNFTTIYPGWYMGRTIHIHFKVRTFAAGAKTYEFTSQVFIDDAINDVVLNQAPYNTRGSRSVRNANDMVFGSGAGSLQMAVQALGGGSSYSGTFSIGLNL